MFIFMQSNNAYIFPGLGLGLIISGAIRVHDDMLLVACKFTENFFFYKPTLRLFREEKREN